MKAAIIRTITAIERDCGPVSISVPAMARSRTSLGGVVHPALTPCYDASSRKICNFFAIMPQLKWFRLSRPLSDDEPVCEHCASRYAAFSGSGSGCARWLSLQQRHMIPRAMKVAVWCDGACSGKSALRAAGMICGRCWQPFTTSPNSTNLRREKAPWQLGPVDAKADAAVQKRRTLVDKKQMGTGYRSFWEKG